MSNPTATSTAPSSLLPPARGLATDPDHAHLRALQAALGRLDGQLPDVSHAAQELVAALGRGGRVLVAGNGGSAAQAQHLTAELVGRFLADRPALSAICLAADIASVTALANDFGAGALFARQVEAHARPGDVLVALSTSGRSINLLRAAEAAQRLDVKVVALTGPRPNPLATVADRCIAVAGASTATIQEVHQVVVHLLCAAVDRALPSGRPPSGTVAR